MLSLVLVLTGCGQTARHVTRPASPPPRPTAPSRQALSHNDAQRLKYFYYGAVAHQNAGHYDVAFELLRHCLSIDPLAPEVHFSLAAYYAELDMDSMSLRCLQRAAELDPCNDTYLERLAQSYVGINEMDKAVKAFEQIYESDRSRTDVLFTILKLYDMQKDHDGMLHTLDRIEAAEGSNEQTALARMRIYEQKGDNKKALECLKRLTEEHPLDMNYRVMMGNWLLQNGKHFEALQEFNKVVEAEPQNQNVRMSLIDYYHAMGQDETAAQLQEQLLISPQTPTDTKIQLIRQVVNEYEQQGADSTKVLALFRRILAQPQTESAMAQMLALYMQMKEMPQDSVEAVLRQALEIEPDEASVRLGLVQMRWEKDDYDGIISLCRPAVEYNPEEMAFYYFLGMAHYQKGEKDDALEAFRQGVTQINEQSNKDLASDFYAIMGDILHEKGRIEECFAAYDSSLQWKPDNYGALNNYAYFLCLEGKNLQKAEQMSYKTVKAEPDNANNLDTYAWILFMQERFEEARIYIDQALQYDSIPSMVVLEHAGDIYACCNDIERAVDFWQQARDAGEDSALLARKIKQRKYIKENKK